MKEKKTGRKAAKMAKRRKIRMIVPRHYENLKILHENTMPNRSYYIPAREKREDLVECRENSDRFQLLNGDWKFRYFESIYDAQEKFYEEGYDTKDFATIPVPSCWQNYGYDRHQYTNVRYPFPMDPPYVPRKIPAENMCIILYMKRWMEHLRPILILKAWIPAFMYGSTAVM